MKYYKKLDGTVWAFESDGSQDSFITSDMLPMTPAEVSAHLNPGGFDQIAASYAGALGAAIDQFARTWGYDSIYTAATYLNSAIPLFKHEAEVIIAWRDTAWFNANNLFNACKAGTATAPSSAAAFVKQVLPPPPFRPIA